VSPIVVTDPVNLGAKLTPPWLPRSHVKRPELLAAILDSASSRIVSIVAPAGYGKTTLLAEWAGVEVRPVGWVSLDSADNDPVTLISAFAAAFGHTQGLGDELREAMSSRGAPVLGLLGPRLAERMRNADREFVMVLDDQHELISTECCDLVDLLVESVPSGSTVVVAGRSEAQSLARWRVRHDVLELDIDDLTFGPDESARFLRQADPAMEQQTVDELHADLEGWVAGLQLALVVARREGGLASFGRGDRYVADYLRREVLDGLSADDRDFLIRTSVLERLSAPLCDTLLGCDDSSARLQALEQASLFLIPMDRQRSRYRYHAAFRELLLDELDRTHGDEQRRRLHLVASEWYDQQELAEEAVEHALKSAHPHSTARLMARVIQEVHARGRVTTIQRWLRELGDDAIADYPPLAAIAGWIAALTGDAPQAEKWALRLEHLCFDGVPTDGSASFESARAMFRAVSCSAGPEQMLINARAALAEEPSWGPWRPTAEAMCAEAMPISHVDGSVSVVAGGACGDASRVTLHEFVEQRTDQRDPAEDVEHGEELRRIGRRRQVAEADSGERDGAEVERVDPAPVLEDSVHDGADSQHEQAQSADDPGGVHLPRRRRR
jgi:LuxR family maltose regulon positive regulatory protein